jgi:hypothetical protein
MAELLWVLLGEGASPAGEGARVRARLRDAWGALPPSRQSTAMGVLYRHSQRPGSIAVDLLRELLRLDFALFRAAIAARALGLSAREAAAPSEKRAPCGGGPQYGECGPEWMDRVLARIRRLGGRAGGGGGGQAPQGRGGPWDPSPRA